VLAEIPEGATIVGGDVAIGGSHPAETLERLRELGDRVRWVRGNGDRELTPGEPGLGPSDAIDRARTRLSQEQIAFLHDLPASLELDGVLYCHASPRNDLDIFTSRTPEDQVAFLFEGVAADIVVCGHTHMQFDRTIAGKRGINAGSVGMPAEDEPGAYWLLDLEHRRTDYAGAIRPRRNREERLAFLETLDR
jgi:putative phosphoesterase